MSIFNRPVSQISNLAAYGRRTLRQVLAVKRGVHVDASALFLNLGGDIGREAGAETDLPEWYTKVQRLVKGAVGQGKNLELFVKLDEGAKNKDSFRVTYLPEGSKRVLRLEYPEKVVNKGGQPVKNRTTASEMQAPIEDIKPMMSLLKTLVDAKQSGTVTMLGDKITVVETPVNSSP